MLSRRLGFLALFILTLITATIVGVYFNDTPQKAPRLVMPHSAKSYRLLVADTPKEQSRGLSDRAMLAQNEGMLFTGSEKQLRCFWMKDMRFSIDMIWLDADKRIVTVEHDVHPDTYPDRQFCNIGQYVVELNAGEAAKNNLHPGDILVF